MAKIYQKKGNQITGTEIRMPDKPSNVLGEMLGSVSKVTAKLSKENYALGKSQLINGVLNEAYSKASDNPKLFNDLVKTGFEKSLTGLDDNTKTKIYEAANDSFKQLQIKVGNNLNARLDAENSERIQALANDALYGETGVKSSNDMLASMMASGKEVSREEFDAIINQRNKAVARLKALAQARNLRGGYIIGDKSMRNAIETENFDMSNTILNAISDLDYESLKKFDETYFQDSKAFKEKTGLDLKDYESLNGKIKNRRKELNEEDKRVINDQSKYNVLAAGLQKNPLLLDQEKDNIPENVYSRLKKVLETPTMKSEALITNEDNAFLHQFSKVLDVASVKYQGNNDFNEILLDKYTDAMESLKTYRERYNTSGTKDDITDDMMYSALTDNLFNSVLGSIEETSLYGQLVKTAEAYKEEANAGKQTEGWERDLQRTEYETPYQARVATVLPNDPDKDETIAQQRHIANLTTMRLAQIGTMMRQTENEETRQSLYNQAVNLIGETNKEILKIKMKPLITEADFDRCVREKGAGGKPLFVSPRNKRTYLFAGITDNEVIIEDEQ